MRLTSVTAHCVICGKEWYGDNEIKDAIRHAESKGHFVIAERAYASAYGPKQDDEG